MKVLRWIGLVLGGLIALVAIAAVVLFFIGRGNLASAPEVSVASVTVSDDPESIKRGEHLARISSCGECHSAQLEGRPFIDEAPIGYIPAANLTSGEGGVGQFYTDEDWARAIRHGVAADGRTIAIMPSNHYAKYGDEDLADLIAYLKQVPPVDSDFGPREIMFPGNIIFGVLANSSWAVNVIDHAAVGGSAPAAGPTAEYGEYLINIASCNSCHAENLAGYYGEDGPPGPNLTVLPERWTEEGFAEAVRTGFTPDGRQLESANDMMPWPNYAGMSDDEVNAIWAYLNTLEPLPDNEE